MMLTELAFALGQWAIFLPCRTRMRLVVWAAKRIGGASFRAPGGEHLPIEWMPEFLCRRTR